MSPRGTSGRWTCGGAAAFLVAVAWALPAGPAAAQAINCCNEHISVGAPWIGMYRPDNCQDYFDNAAGPILQALCRERSRLACLNTERCSTLPPEDSYCGYGPDKGWIYAGTLSGRMHADPSRDSPVVYSPPGGAHLRYSKTSVIDGEVWYYINMPGRPAGWFPGHMASCTRPHEPPAPKRVLPLPPTGPNDRRPIPGTGGARG